MEEAGFVGDSGSVDAVGGDFGTAGEAAAAAAVGVTGGTGTVVGVAFGGDPSELPGDFVLHMNNCTGC